MKLTSEEENLNENELFLKWLIEGKVDFVSLSKQYTRYLEHENQKQLIKNSRYSTLLAQYLQYAKMNKKSQWVEDKTIGTLYAYQDFKTAPVYKEWEALILDRNINTNLDTLSWEVYKLNEDT